MATAASIPILHETGAVINQRYTVMKRLGAGAMGEVYLVSDAERDGLQMAMKYLLGQTDSALERFKREFTILAHLHHPNITGVYDLELDRDHHVHFFTTEYVIGKSFDQAAQQLPQANVLDLFVQSLRALAYLHGHGLLHYDIKGANLLVTNPEHGTPQAKLIDFGVADQGWNGKRRGTPSYMAPEIIDGQATDHRADLYSLGVLMYVTLTNWNPFRGSTRDITYDRHRTFMPPPPSSRNPALPDYLDQIILRLLEKRPDDRYADATEVIQDLNRRGPVQYDIETPDTLHSYVPTAGPFIGREMERTQLEAQLTHPNDGSSPLRPISWIRGARGTGKTRLLREAKWLAQLHDYATFLVNPRQPGAATELATALSAVARSTPERRIWIGIDNADELPDLPEWQRSLALLQAQLANLTPQHLLCAAKQYYPLVVVLATADTTEANQRVAHHCQIDPQDTCVLPLHHFSITELAQYLAVCTGISAVPDPLVNLIWRYSAGNPFFVTELLQRLIADGRLFDSAGRWHATTFDDLGLELDCLTIPETLVAHVAHDYQQLPAAHQQLLALMAVWEAPAPLTHLSHVMGEVIASQTLADLVQAGFISYDPPARCYTFRVATHRHAIYQLLPDTERRHWHDQLAAFYAAHPQHYIAQWTHDTHGSDAPRAHRAHWRLALYANQREHPRDTLRHCRALGAEQPAPPLAIALLHTRALTQLQQPGDALRYLHSVAPHLTTPTALLACAETTAVLATTLRDFSCADAALTTARTMWQTLGGTDAALALRLDNTDIELARRQPQHAEALATAIRRYRATAAEAALLPATAQVRVRNNELGPTLFQHGNFTEAIQVLQHTSDWYLQQGLNANATPHLYYLAEAYRNTNKLADAHVTCLRALANAKAQHTPALLMYVYQCLGAIEESLGHIPEAIAALSRSMDLCQRLGSTHRTLNLLVPLNMGILHRRAGDYKLAEYHLLASLGYYHQHAGTSSVDAPYAGSAHLELAELYRLTQRFGLAHHHIDLAEQLAAAHDTCRHLLFYIVTTKLEIHRDAGETDQARQLAPRMRELATNTNLLHTASEVESSIIEETTLE